MANNQPTLIHPATNPDGTCVDPACPCHEWSAKSPSETYHGHPRLDTGLKIDSKAVSGAGMTTCHDCDGSGTDGEVAGPCPYYGGSGQVEIYAARQQRSDVPIPTFEQEWQDAPKWATRLTEQQIAHYWFIRGQHAKEVELLAGMNVDLREMIRVARERIGR